MIFRSLAIGMADESPPSVYFFFLWSIGHRSQTNQLNKTNKNMKTNETLTPQQQRFCEEYLVSFNAYKSAIAAGYSQSTARKAEMLHLPQVQAFLKAGMQKTSERLQVTHDMVLRELYKIAFANMGDYYDENAVLRPINQLSDDQKAAISQYQLIDCIGDYQERAGEISKIKLHNKLSALDKIARHIGFYLQKSESRRSESPEVSKGSVLSGEDGVLSQESEGLEIGVECVAVSEAVTGRAENTPLAPLDRGIEEKSLTIAPFLSNYVVSKRGTSEKSLRSDIHDRHVGHLVIAEDFSSLSSLTGLVRY
jgi:phage terminase small subunit